MISTVRKRTTFTLDFSLGIRALHAEPLLLMQSYHVMNSAERDANSDCDIVDMIKNRSGLL